VLDTAYISVFISVKGKFLDVHIDKSSGRQVLDWAIANALIYCDKNLRMQPLMKSMRKI